MTPSQRRRRDTGYSGMCHDASRGEQRAMRAPREAAHDSRGHKRHTHVHTHTYTHRLLPTPQSTDKTTAAGHRHTRCSSDTAQQHAYSPTPPVLSTPTPSCRHGPRVTRRTRTQHTRRWHTLMSTGSPPCTLLTHSRRRRHTRTTPRHVCSPHAPSPVHTHAMACTVQSQQRSQPQQQTRRCRRHPHPPAVRPPPSPTRLHACRCVAGPDTPSLSPPRHVQHTQTHDGDTDTAPMAPHASQRHVG